MKFDELKLKEILLRENYVSAQDVAAAEASKTALLEYVLSKNILTKDLLGQAIAESFSIPYADLNSKPPTPGQVQKIPEETAKKLRVVVFYENEKLITFATDAPSNPKLQKQLAALFPKKKVALAYGLEEDIDASFLHYQKSLDTRFSKIISENKRVAPEILEEIFDDAITYNASDIHFEPQGDRVIVRFRVDGVLQEAGTIPSAYYENILNRVKVQSRLRIDEHYKAQDGSLRYEKNNVATDMRTSIVPTVEGEKIVLRVLASYVQGLSLTDIGLSVRDQALLQEMSDNAKLTEDTQLVSRIFLQR